MTFLQHDIKTLARTDQNGFGIDETLHRIELSVFQVDSGAECDNETRAGYTPLHVAAHFGQINMVRYLLSQGVRVDVQNELGYTPLHQVYFSSSFIQYESLIQTRYLKFNNYY